MKRTHFFTIFISILLIFGTAGFTVAQTSVNANISGYFVALNGQSTGPYNASGLRQLVDQGQLTRNSLVWKEGMANWAAAGTVEELASLFPVAPPPLPASQSPPPIPDQVTQTTVQTDGIQTDNVQTSNRKWYNSFASGLENNNVFINTGVGYGPTGGINMGIPPLSISFDIKISNSVPITIGPTLIFSTWKSGYFNYTYWNFGIGGRAMYHFNFVKNLDVYAGPTVGYAIRFFGEDFEYDHGYVLWGGYTGARYFFTKVIGVYTELGYSGLQYVNAGLSLKI
jgi:hypothetical protein